ncbi:MAG: hypothetical protein HY685_03020 [Chloroflexi bacterium]|nr:hypothetical protein [Chloroflexota bacterium]
MELTSDPEQAEVMVFYLLNLGKALFIDKRRSGEIAPLVEVFPQEELLLEGKDLEAPLTPQVVHLIERRQIMPPQPLIMQSYMRQLLQIITWKLTILRPGLRSPRYISIGPHFAPVPLLAGSELWRGVLRYFELRGEEGALHQAKEKMRELYLWEILRYERVDPEQVEALRRDFYSRELFWLYGLGS